jgi:hypothetical protein
MATTNQPSPAIVKKIQTLAQIAADLRQGKDYNITRLTLIKSLCSDPDAAAEFTLYIAKLAQRQFKARRPGDTKSQKTQTYGKLIAAAMPAMTRCLKSPTEKTESTLWELYERAKEAQSRVEHQQWADVRIIECWELLIVEKAADHVMERRSCETPICKFTRRPSSDSFPHRKPRKNPRPSARYNDGGGVGRGLSPATLGFQTGKSPFVALFSPSGQVRRVQTFTAQHGAELAGLGRAIGFLESTKLVLGGEASSHGLLWYTRVRDRLSVACDRAPRPRGGGGGRRNSSRATPSA